MQMLGPVRYRYEHVILRADTRGHHWPSLEWLAVGNSLRKNQSVDVSSLVFSCFFRLRLTDCSPHTQSSLTSLCLSHSPSRLILLFFKRTLEKRAGRINRYPWSLVAFVAVFPDTARCKLKLGVLFIYVWFSLFLQVLHVAHHVANHH